MFSVYVNQKLSSGKVGRGSDRRGMTRRGTKEVEISETCICVRTLHLTPLQE